MTHDRDYFRRRAAEARAAACAKDEGDQVEVAGQLALAYSALARRHSDPPAGATDDPADAPLILRS